jgi:CRISPR-associated endoribonuclease Cas6
VELGSPLAAVVQAWAASLAAQRVIDWGGAAFHVDRVQVVEPPSFTSGYARLRTTTPVVIKGSGRDMDGQRVTRQAWLLPTDSEFPVYFTGNLRRKAETLGLDPRGVPRSHEVEDLEGSVHETGCPSGGLGDVASPE